MEGFASGMEERIVSSYTILCENPPKLIHYTIRIIIDKVMV